MLVAFPACTITGLESSLHGHSCAIEERDVEQTFDWIIRITSCNCGPSICKHIRAFVYPL